MLHKIHKLIPILLVPVFLGTVSPVTAGDPGGCIKYGAAGAVAGHVANHHAVIGAVGGCAAGMVHRHRYRQELREKAALWDKEHPDQKKRWESLSSIRKKAIAYDMEHASQENAAAATPATTNTAPANTANAPSTAPAAK